MNEELTSPPYPGEAATADGLYTDFGELQKWVALYRDGLNDLVGQEVIPAAQSLPDRRAYTTQPIVVQYQHLLFIRRLREEWDHLVRSFESEWNNSVCVRARISLVQAAALAVNTAFVPHELREARHQQFLERVNRVFESIIEATNRGFSQKSYDPESPGRPGG